MIQPRYYTVNITVENEVGEVFALWRVDTPILNVEQAFTEAIGAIEVLKEETDLRFDRMDDQ